MVEQLLTTQPTHELGRPIKWFGVEIPPESVIELADKASEILGQTPMIGILVIVCLGFNWFATNYNALLYNYQQLAIVEAKDAVAIHDLREDNAIKERAIEQLIQQLLSLKTSNGGR